MFFGCRNSKPKKIGRGRALSKLNRKIWRMGHSKIHYLTYLRKHTRAEFPRELNFHGKLSEINSRSKMKEDQNYLMTLR